jgi:hypothetical protein
MPVPSQFNTDRTYPGRWTITFSNPPINMFVPTTICRIGSANDRPQGGPVNGTGVFLHGGATACVVGLPLMSGKLTCSIASR